MPRGVAVCPAARWQDTALAAIVLPVGRPPIELTDKRERRILDATRKGLSRSKAARSAGISPALLYEWLARGRAGEAPFAEFVERVKLAEAEGEEVLLDLVQMHAATTWQAAKWLLEIRNPKRYVVQQKVAHEVQLTPEEARAKYRAITGKEWGE